MIVFFWSSHSYNSVKLLQSAHDDNDDTTTTTILRPLYRATCVSWHRQLRTGRFCCRNVLLPACPCWWQLAHSDYEEDARVLSGVIYLHHLRAVVIVIIVITTRMWANAQRDGRPAEYRWRLLFNATKFGRRTLLECRAITLPRCETRW